MKERGKLIVVEACINRLGKTTLVNAIIEKMQAKGINVKQYHFHDRTALTGQYIENLHTGNLPFDIKELDPLFIVNLYLLDMAAHIEQINKDLEEGYYVILDRYFYSSMIYQTTTSKVNHDNREYMSLLDNIIHLAQNTYKLPQPDLTFFLWAADIIPSYYNSVEDTIDGFEKHSFQRELIKTTNYILDETDYFDEFIVINKGHEGNTVETPVIMENVILNYLPELA